MKKVLVYSLILACIIGIDLYSKHIVENRLQENESIPVAGNVVKFTLTYNYGTTFGLFKNNAPYITISVVKLEKIDSVVESRLIFTYGSDCSTILLV